MDELGIIAMHAYILYHFLQLIHLSRVEEIANERNKNALKHRFHWTFL